MKANTLRAMASVSCAVGGVRILLDAPPNGRIEGLLAVILGVLLWILVELKERN